MMKDENQRSDAGTTFFTDYPDVVSVEELSRMLQISMGTAYKLLRKREIESLRIGHIYKIPKLHVLRFLHLVS